MNIDNKKVRLKEKEKINLRSSDNELLAGRFEVVELIGEGGSGLVYKVRDLNDESIYALKLLKLDFQSDKSAFKRFQREAENLSKVSHKNLVSVKDHGVLENGTPFILMEYFESRQLKSLISESKGGLPLADTLKIFMDILKGIEAIHAAGIIHRDVTTKNILLQKRGNNYKVKLVDFGIAKSLPTASSTTQGFTETGKVFGTPDYMSPEQCLSKPVDKSSDIYSLGCCLYETLNGTPPFEGANAIETMLKHTEEKAPALKRDLKNNTKINRIIAKAMAKVPKHRFSSAKELRVNIEKLRRDALLIGPLSYKEKLASFALISLVILGLTTSTIIQNPKVKYYLNRHNQVREAPTRIGTTNEYIALPPADMQRRIDNLVADARDTGKQMERPWMKPDGYYKSSQAAYRKYDTIAKSVYELGPKAAPYIVRYANDDVAMVRQLCDDTIKNRHTFPTYRLTEEMINHNGPYYSSALRLLGQGGNDSVELLLDKVRTGETKQKERAIGLIAAAVLNTRTDIELTESSKETLFKELDNKQIRNAHLIPSILISLDKDSPDTLSALEKHLASHENNLVREACASSLGVYLSQPAATRLDEAIEALKKSVYSDSSPKVRLASLANLSAQADRLNMKLNDFLNGLTKNEDLQIKYAARVGLALQNMASKPTSYLSTNEARDALNDANSKTLNYSEIERLVNYVEHQSGYFGNYNDDKRGILLPIMVRKAIGPVKSFYIRSDQRSEFIALQSWIFNSAYQGRFSYSPNRLINYVYFADTIKHKNTYKDPIY